MIFPPLSRIRHSHTLHACFTTPGTIVCLPALSISSIFSRPLHQLLVFQRKRPLCSRLHYIKYSYWVELQTTYLDHTFSFIVTPINTQARRQKKCYRETSTSRKQGRGRGGGVLPYMGYLGMCRCEGYGFPAVYSRIGYTNERVWV